MSNWCADSGTLYEPLYRLGRHPNSMSGFVAFETSRLAQPRIEVPDRAGAPALKALNKFTGSISTVR